MNVRAIANLLFDESVFQFSYSPVVFILRFRDYNNGSRNATILNTC